MLIFCWFSSGVFSIYVDGAMGIILGFMILAVYELSDPRDFWVPIFIAAFLAITKETDFCLSLLSILAISLKIFKNKKYKR
ncbi:MAG: hypothetical protein HOP07_01030 [Bacteriovoracaceae bacterium]|nr:hypothetical protein [Bacteriovoracaceae bacterium]